MHSLPAFLAFKVNKLYLWREQWAVNLLCKIWGFHRVDYDECSLLEHENPVRTSQESYYFFATESSRLMLCKI
jgi:hypothetical protein